MRNKYPGFCYRCNELVEAGLGHFERLNGKFRLQHAHCAIEHRGKPDKARIAQTERERQTRIRRWEELSKGTGKQAKRARQKLANLDKG